MLVDFIETLVNIMRFGDDMFAYIFGSSGILPSTEGVKTISTELFVVDSTFET